MHPLLFSRLIICHNRLCNPFGQCLTIVFQHETLLIPAITDISQFQVNSCRLGISKHIQSALADGSPETSSRLMLLVLLLKRIPHSVGQTLPLFTSRCMIKKDIRLFTLTATIHVNKNSALVFTFIFPIKFINLLRALLQPCYLIQRNRFSHTSFPLAVLQRSAEIADFAESNASLHAST